MILALRTPWLRNWTIGLVWMIASFGAWSQANPEIASCQELKDPTTIEQVEFCKAHLGCRMVMQIQNTCTKAKQFLERVKESVGEGIKTLFGYRKEVRSEDVFRAATPDDLAQSSNKDPAWKRASESVAEGVVKADKRSLSGGTGKEAWSYVGDVRDGLPSGWGTRFDADGRIVRGEFSEGKPNGLTDAVLPEQGVRQTGNASNGQLAGKGFEVRQGETYVGGFVDGQRQGFGTVTSPDGSRFEGVFKGGAINGPGTRYRSDGTVSERGTFGPDGQLVSGQRLGTTGQVGETLSDNSLYGRAELVGKSDHERRLAESEALRRQQEAEGARKRAQEQERREALARERAAFEAKLSKANPGELFTLADELAEKGDVDQAKQVRRLLISKFPDHALAATAARQMQATSSSLASNSGTGSSGGSKSRYSSACMRNEKKILGVLQKNNLNFYLSFGRATEKLMGQWKLVFQPCAASDPQAAQRLKDIERNLQENLTFCNQHPDECRRGGEWGVDAVGGDQRESTVAANQRTFAVLSEEVRKANSDPDYSVDLDGGRSAGSIASQNGADCDGRIAAQEREFDSINRRRTPDGTTPMLQRVMWLSKERIKLIKNYCPETAKYRQMIVENQRAYDEADKACGQMTIGNVCPGPNAY